MKRKYTRWIAMCAVGAVLVSYTAACDFADELLKVNNPSQIPVDSLEDPLLMEVLTNGVVGNFNQLYDNPVIAFSTLITDEMLNGVNWEGTARIGQRIVHWNEATGQNPFAVTSRSLRHAHNLAENIRGWMADDPDLEDAEEYLATALAFAGYSALVMGEHMCRSVISLDPDSTSGDILSAVQTLEYALPYLEEAVTVATSAGASDIANLARVGLARANLSAGRWNDAATWASQVPAGYEYWLEYMSDPSSTRNYLRACWSGSNFFCGIHPWFTGTHPSFDGTGFEFEDNDIIDVQTDPRIQHLPSDRTGHNRLTRLYKLIQGLRYGDYTGETQAPASAACPACTGTDDGDMELLAAYDTDILLADYTEAQHHYWEAIDVLGTDEAGVLAFVNARRAVGNQAPVTLTGQALTDELRRQRAKDLFMGGFRVGDLRRWDRNDPGNGPFPGGEYFPTGVHPTEGWGDYGVWTCFPIPLDEYNGNLQLQGQKPTDPSVPQAR